MNSSLKIYNTLSRKKVLFEPLHAPHVGIYVCGPTVYSDVHLGNCRTFTTFDVVVRYLRYLGYQVRYLRNITDVGHLVDDVDEGEDKIAKRAKLENLEPMEIVQRYTVGFHKVMQQLNNLPPSIEPTATGHISEQITLIEQILARGYAYVANGSVYFDVPAYLKNYPYGELSGRVVEDLLSSTRDLDGQNDKKHPADFALWKLANSAHIMRWPSPWGEGFPGWHIECSAMSTKYLGQVFDIHGGGMDLQFPHHECEIAQARGAHEHAPVRYWMHANMLTMNGQKMSKSLGNSILPKELFLGSHPLLSQPFSPMTLRFAFLQTHYRSTMDLSADALKAAQIGYKKLMNGLRIAKRLTEPQSYHAPNDKLIAELLKTCERVLAGLDDDFNTAVALAALFDLAKKLSQFEAGQLSLADLDAASYARLKTTYIDITEKVLGLVEEQPKTEGLVSVLLSDYAAAKSEKNFERVDALRAIAKSMGLAFKDMKTGITWTYDEA
ncbi:MAG: cysteine--tRNA ligase [Cytophagales bacterium]|nr:MAG: cysteine--tRNA ligase [Cytophagales bacterium]TAF60554.1 MAG: cysteine--tRNA ligase [Cytophagales bacterium]